MDSISKIITSRRKDCNLPDAWPGKIVVPAARSARQFWPCVPKSTNLGKMAMTSHRKAVWFGILMLALSALAWLQGPLTSLAQLPHPFGGVVHALAKYV